MRHRCLFVSLVLVLAGSQPGALFGAPRIEFYPTPTERNDAPTVQLRIQGQPALISSHRIQHPEYSSDRAHFMDVQLARFAADGPVDVTLIASPSVAPVVHALGRNIPAHARENAIEFQLPGPGRYWIDLPALATPGNTCTLAIWCDDLVRLDRSRAAWEKLPDANVLNRGVSADSSADQTTAIQRLLDRHGALLFPPGVYRTGSLRIGSDTQIYLAPGAVLRGSNSDDAVGAQFISIDHAHNVRIEGPGVIDANGSQRTHNVHNIDITASRDVSFDGTFLEGSNSWAMHICKTDHFTANNVSIFSGKDGFDPDSSRDVNIDGAFCVCGDDAIAVKNRYPDDPDGGVTQRITFRNSIVSTTKSALKIGTETRGPIRDVTFQNCDVFNGERGIVLYARDGGPIERALWREIRLHMIDWPQEPLSGAVFDINIQRRQAPTPVRDCLIENVTANWISPSQFAGLAESPLNGIAIRNLTAHVEHPKSKRPCLFECGHDVALTIGGLKIDWQGNEMQWAGVASGSGITISKASNP